MSLPSTPPHTMVYSVEHGDDGWPVYSVQSALNSIRFAESTSWPRADLDGAFGDLTEKAVRGFQDYYHLSVDGKFGPASSRKAIERLDARVHSLLPAVPNGLLKGMAEGEGANNFGAVNWSVPGGVDCGIMQYRCYGAPFSFSVLQAAFAPVQAMLRAGADFLGRADTFYDAAGVRNRSDRAEFSKRLAILAHNWPAGAKDIAMDGKLTNPDGLASWVPGVVKFPDGTLVKTRQQWAEFYSLGGVHGSAYIPKYITDWT